MQQIEFIGERLKSARIMNGYSLQDLADKLNNLVSRQALHKYEKGGASPDEDKLNLLAKILQVDKKYFFITDKVELSNVEFRKTQQLSVKEQNRITASITNYLEQYFKIEQVLGIDTRNFYKLDNPIVNSNEDIEVIVSKIRTKWFLGLEAIPNVVELLEEQNFKIIEIDSNDSFDGLSAEAGEEKQPIIVLNKLKLNSAIDRKRFTTLHELAHLLLKLDHHSDRQKELFCHYFAAAMLFPKDVAYKILGRHRNRIFIPELGNIKKQYGISIQAIIYRLKDLEIINQNYFKQLMFFISQKGMRTTEPPEYDYKGIEKSTRFEQLVYRALAENLIDIEKAAKMLNEDVSSLQKML
jgi:Zn-dependent peptidase ImmA (M78 family)/DNA-binding XRE family transcriptional regulator